MFRHVRYSLRLVAIGCILARYRVLFILAPLPYLRFVLSPLVLLWKPGLPKRPGQRLALALQAIGPTFTKFGQSLSTRADVIGADIAQDLGDLRDNLPPFSTKKALAIISASLSGRAEDFFQSIDAKPVAAASIAQVHFARTLKGENVAIKILRPNVALAFARDLDLMYWLAEQIEKHYPAWRRLKPIEVVRLFESSVKLELDLRFEAAAATELRKNMEGVEGFKVPYVHWPLSNKQIMTMERIDGIPVHDVAALKAAGHDLNLIMSRAAKAFFKQTLQDGFFHADLHPGNLFIEADGTMAVVDFGIMGRLDEKTRFHAAQVLYGLSKQDFQKAAQAHFDAGWVPADQSVDNFTMALMAIAKPVLGRPLNEVSIGSLLGQMFEVTEMFRMETQTQLLLLQKTMVVLEGVGRMLNPNVNIWKFADGEIEAWVEQNVHPINRIKMSAKELLQLLMRLPEMLKEFEAALKRINAEGKDDDGSDGCKSA